MFDVTGVTAITFLAGLFGWLTRRGRRLKRPVVRRAGMLLAGLLTVAVTGVLLIVLVGFYRLSVPPYRYSIANVKVAGTPEQVARGQRLSGLCLGCHSPAGDPPLIGQDFSKGGGPPIGRLFAQNLTPAGELKGWSDGEIIRAIREGIHQTGRPLVIMPSEVFRNFSDADVEAIVAYLRAQPAVGPLTPPPRLNALVAFFMGAGMFLTSAQAPITHPVLAPPDTSAAYGRYLVGIMGCPGCHGEKLEGGTAGRRGSPQGPNLTQLVPRWSEAEFIRTLRTGVDPNNHALAEGMPWKEISAAARDQDLAAVYRFVLGLHPVRAPSP